jgi:hypothetical protein
VNNKVKTVLIILISLMVLSGIVSSLIYNYGFFKPKVIRKMYIYRDFIVNGQHVSDDVLMVKNEEIARKVIEFYHIKGSASFLYDFIGDIRPFDKVDVLGYSTDSSIARIGIVFSGAHKSLNYTIGYVPSFALHDTLPKDTITGDGYEAKYNRINRTEDSLDSVAQHLVTLNDIEALKKIAPVEITKIEIHYLDFSTHQMENKQCEDFMPGSRSDYLIVINKDSIMTFMKELNNEMAEKNVMNNEVIDVKHGQHKGGIMLFCKDNKTIYLCFTDFYICLGEKIFIITKEYRKYLVDILTNCKKAS